MQVGPLIKSIMAGLQLAQPAAIIGNSDPVAVQMLACLSGAADELLRRYPYTRLLPGGLWVQPTSGSAIAVPLLDTDDVLFDTPTIRAAIKWRWQEANGLDYSEAFRQAEESLARIAASHTRLTREEVDL